MENKVGTQVEIEEKCKQIEQNSNSFSCEKHKNYWLLISVIRDRRLSVIKHSST